MIDTYVRSGQVRLVFRAVLNHGERSVRASEAAACAGRQGQFWAMHQLLFEAQDTLYATGTDGLAGLMLALGEQLPDLDSAVFAECVTGRQALAALEAADAEQRTRGITSQPIFDINGQRLVGYQSFEVVAALIDQALSNP